MNLACPTSGKRCSYREHLPEIFTSVALTVDAQRENCFNPLDDEKKLGRRLIEHSVVAQMISCAGMDEDGNCPTAERMADSSSRRTVKGVLSLFRK